MKHKEKRLVYVRQYQTMSAEEWQKVVFSDENIFNLDGQDGFQRYWRAKHFPEENYSTKPSGYEGGGGFSNSGKLKFQFVCGRQKAADYVKMLNDLSVTQKEHHLCGEEWIFQQDNAAIHNASITKKYLFDKKNKIS